MPKRCFILGPSINPSSDAYKDAQKIRKAIREAAEESEYETTTQEDMNKPGLMSKEFIRSLMEFDLVVADLSGIDPNVYYGLAVRHASGKPTIQIVRKGIDRAWIIRFMNTIVYDDDSFAIRDALIAAIAKVGPEVDLDTPIGGRIIDDLFNRVAKDHEKIVATFFESAKNELSASLADLKRLTAEIEDATRKPLHGIEQVLFEAHEMLVNKARDGGQVWFVGMTLGLGPPHRYRMSGAARNATILGEIVAAVADGEAGELGIDDELKRRYPGRELKIDKMIDVFHSRLEELFKAAPRAVVVCLPHQDGCTLENNFLKPLASRANYTRLKSEEQITSLANEIREKHAKIACHVEGGVGYLDSIPLQMLIVEKKEDQGHSKKACLVFHVGTDNLGTLQQDNGEVGFYTEVDSIVEVFQTTAESLREAARRRALS